jgi:hypothetical protein
VDQKVFSDQNLARGFPVESKARQGNGRETAGKPETVGSPFGGDLSLPSC